ncbi:ferredoxin [Nostoc calcicola FACHB-389]|nr:(2Fe-2S)-binding protein [Nostoc calcicola FACHB-3891]OKH24052.1 ferredoxin [Nostoc calcicola FACHB-389]
MKDCVISFADTSFPELRLKPHDALGEYLTVQNSPVLFGCRTGLCGTCLVKVKGDIPPPQAEEQEVLQILASADPQARLACQIDLTGDITIQAYAV